MVDALRMWSARRWRVAVLGGFATAILVALPTAVIPNPVFGRAVEVTWWSYPVVVITGILGGLLLATYVKEPGLEEGKPAEEARALYRPEGELTSGAVGSTSGAAQTEPPSRP